MNSNTHTLTDRQTRAAIRKLTLLLALAAGSIHAAESTYQSHQSMQALAADYVTQQALRFSVPPMAMPGELDSRLRLTRCTKPLEAFESPGGLKPGRSVVGIRCNDERPWKIYVPVQISLPAEVVVLARDIRRGETISAADLRTRQGDLAKLRGQYYQTMDEVVGYRVKRNLSANLVLSPAMLDAQRLVERGAEVTIVADTAAIDVRMRGKAMAHGGRGDQIRVKNNRSGRIITATVMDRGLVKVGP